MTTANIQERQKSWRNCAWLILLALWMAGCGKPFDVKPKKMVNPPPGANYTATAEASGLTVSAEAVTNEDYLLDTFDANLILAGVLPVRVKLSNTGKEKIELKDAKFGLKAADNHLYKRMDAEKTYKRLRKYYGVILYNKAGNMESKADFKTYDLNEKESIVAGEARDGMIFFSVPTEVINQGNFALVARKLTKDKMPIELKLK